MAIQPYLFFEGRCDEAIAFYQQKLGASVEMLMRYQDSPEPGSCPAGMEKKVMHASIRIGDACIMMSDGRCSGPTAFQGFALTLAVRQKMEAECYFAALADGGTVHMPLGKTFFSPAFGMVTDRLGVMWMILMTEE